MGGRGASSPDYIGYGSEYKSLFQKGNVKFIVQNGDGRQKAPLETRTRGRVYALIDRNTMTVKSIVYFDNKNKRSKQVDLQHKHKDMQPHTHHGYEHSEFEIGKKGASKPTVKEKKMIERVTKDWYNYLKKQKM